jgi:SNF5 / SMARCB1 / INI1
VIGQRATVIGQRHLSFSNELSLTIDDLITTDGFAKLLVNDMKLPQQFIALVSKSIKDQIDDFFQHHPAPLKQTIRYFGLTLGPSI